MSLRPFALNRLFASNILLGCGVLAYLCYVSPVAQAQQTERAHTVRAAVASVSNVSISSLPSPSVGPGSGDVGTGRYSVVTNRPASQSIVVSVEGMPPKGVALFVALEPPDGAQRTGGAPLKVLSKDGKKTPRALVTGIGQVSETGLEVSVRTEVGVQATPGATDLRLSFELAK